jgi:hypothetical protein
MLRPSFGHVFNLLRRFGEEIGGFAAAAARPRGPGAPARPESCPLRGGFPPCVE